MPDYKYQYISFFNEVLSPEKNMGLPKLSQELNCNVAPKNARLTSYKSKREKYKRS